MLLFKIQRSKYLNILRNYSEIYVRPKDNYTANRTRAFVGFTLVGFLGGTLYDAANEFQYCGSATRFARSLRIAISISMDYKWNLSGLPPNSAEYEKARNDVHKRSAEKLLHGCLANGGLYIKIGQGVSSINHILPIEYTETLKKLENECLPRKPDEVRRLFLQDFGVTPDELFGIFNYTPIAAASLAQVFQATTKGDGKPVAVKVQYIDLERRFAGDFGTILFIQNLVKLVHDQYNFSWILTDLKANLEQELDFIHEGKNSEQCAKDLIKFKYVHIPEVHWNFTSKHILTTEWIDGYKISDLERIKCDGFKLDDVDKKLFSVFGEQIFNTGFVHADPHPGNVFLRKSKNGLPEIILLDHGLYEKLSNSTRLSLCKFWEAIVMKDLQGMNKYSTELNVSDCEKLAEILLQRPFSIQTSNLTTRLTEKDLVYMQDMAKKRFDTVLLTLKQMPRTMLFVIRNLNTIRAIARNHGDPVDRPKYMAKYAQKCIYQNDRSSLSSLKWFIRRLKFEYHFLRATFTFWIIKTYLRILSAMNRSPDTSSLFMDYDIDVVL